MRKRGALPTLAAVVVALVVGVSAAWPASAAARGCDWAGANPANVAPVKVHYATFCLLNKQRKRHGVRRLRVNLELAWAAYWHSRSMAHYDFFSHYSRNGDNPTDRIRASGYLDGSRRWGTGETIAWGSGWRSKPKHIVSAWMQSSAHRRQILNPSFRHVGVGIARGTPTGPGSGGTYTADFGYR